MGTQSRKIDHWLKETVFHDHKDYFEEMEKDLARAKSNVDFESYIFAKDKIGNRLLDAFCECAKRGVRVRVLMDGLGSSQWDSKQIRKYHALGVHIVFFHPLPWQRRHFDFLKYFSIKAAIRGLYKLNSRNHRKTCIIDRAIVYTGGINVSDASWRDTAIRVENSPDSKEIKTISNAFEKAWQKWDSQSFFSRGIPQCELVRLNNTRKSRQQNYFDLIRKILQAKERIWLTTPYLSPHISMIRALRVAAWAGVDVRLILPKKNDVPLMEWINRAYYPILLEAGVKIYEYKTKILHAKVTLIDEWASVGSTNLNHRSLIHDLELDIVLRNDASIKSLSDRFEKDLEESQAINITKWRRRSLINQVIEKLFLLLRRWV
jgi:cardiolipin synthase A/B